MFGGTNASVNSLTAELAVLPSEAENVTENTPECAESVEGVKVNTFEFCERVAVLPSDPVVTADDHVMLSPSGSVADSVRTIGVPDWLKLYVEDAPLIAPGLAFVKVPTSHQPLEVYIIRFLLASISAISPATMPVWASKLVTFAWTTGPISAAAAVTKTTLSVVAVIAELLALLLSLGVRLKVVPLAVYTPEPISKRSLGPSIV
jgi:hypothetical protein